MFDHTTNTEILIDGKKHLICFENGMTGIGSRSYWVDDKRQRYNSVRNTKDITNGNHFIYTIKWRDTPWDKVDCIVHEDYLDVLLSDENKWRDPIKRNFKVK